VSDPYTHRAFAALTLGDVEAVLTALAEHDHTEAGRILDRALHRISTKPALPAAVVPSGQAGRGQEGLSVESEIQRLFALKSLAGETP